MVKCPKCGAEVEKPSKEWSYRAFHVKRYDCPNCGTWFREYYHQGKLKFVLMPEPGKGIRKVERREQ
ncbi:MAG: hypothetical protein DRJ69_04385 [Thermoprotei archaeon]|nr:MAG: hypothetical protein DRJ69_04385 [Thermoprotei archaeon]